MRKKILLLILVIGLLSLWITTHADSPVSNIPPDLPKEMIVFDLSKNGLMKWQELFRYTDEEYGRVAYIPTNQTEENWSESIGIVDSEEGSLKVSVKDYLDTFHDTLIARHPENIFIWRVVEKTESDAIFEYIVHKSHESALPQHEICRVILTSTGSHQIVFIKKNGKLTPDEREKWIKSFRESVSIVHSEVATNMNHCLSLINPLKDSLNLGPVFKDWKVSNTYFAENNCSRVIRTPPWHIEKKAIRESLEVETMPKIYLSSTKIDDIFNLEKETSQKIHSLETIVFHVLKKSPDEIIYTYAVPYSYMPYLFANINVITRTFISDRGYYSIVYNCVLKREFTNEETQLWKSRLEAIEIRDVFKD